ncbi:MAG: zinc dependent phospholipase C family protein [Clostridiales bacterium]|nr:zinc dependent phospholipase C family protein [Clostridiales bacterium]
MPGFITHYICGEATINELPRDIQDILQNSRQLYNVGCQGPDMFFYYLPGLIKKNMKNLGVDMHKTNVRSFFSHMLDNMSAAGGEDRLMIFSYICGYLSHYTLDCGAHPYVYYKSGFRVEGDKTPRLRYSVRHRSFETAIDVLMLKIMSGEKPASMKLWQLIKADKSHAIVIADALSDAISGAYDRRISPKEVFSAIRYMVGLTRILQSKRGRRKRLMELAEDLTIGDHVVSSVIHTQDVNDGVDYLNLKKKPWYMPWDGDNEMNHSFGDMYNQAVDDGTKLIKRNYMFLTGSISKETLLKDIGNRSLASGLDIDEDKVFYIHGSMAERQAQ